MKLKSIKKVKFDEFTHSYLCGDKVLIGITTLMKNQGLSPDYVGIDETVLKNAAQRGTSVHSLFEVYDDGKPAIPADVISNIDGRLLQSADEQARLLKSYSAQGLNVLCSEYLVSDCDIVASFIDKVIYVDENTVDLGDVKTTSELHRDALSWQLSFYKYFFEKQNKGIKVRKLLGIHARNGAVKVVEVPAKDMSDIKDVLQAEKEKRKWQKTTNLLPAEEVIGPDALQSLIGNEAQLALLEENLKEVKERVASIKDKLYATMLEKNIDELPFEGGSIKLKRPYQTSRVDSKTLKEKFPEVASQVMKTSEVKGNVSVTFNS